MPSFFVCVVGTCGVAWCFFFFFEREMLIKAGPAVKNKFHKLVEEIIIWEKMAAEISRVFVKEEIYCNI